MTIAAAVYAHPRVRGLAPWCPQKRTQKLLEQVVAVLDEYADHLPLLPKGVGLPVLQNYIDAARSASIPLSEQPP